MIVPRLLVNRGGRQEYGMSTEFTKIMSSDVITTLIAHVIEHHIRLLGILANIIVLGRTPKPVCDVNALQKSVQIKDIFVFQHFNKSVLS